MARQPLLRRPWPGGRTLDELELQELAAELREANLSADAGAEAYQSLLERLRARLRGSKTAEEARDAE